jgi:hypothetical protein
MAFRRFLLSLIGLTLVILFLVACGTPRTPRIIEHPQPTLVADASIFGPGGSAVREECRRISDAYGGLDPNHPTAVCTKEWESGDQCLRESGGFIRMCERVIVHREGTFQLITTQEELRDLFAPIESADEALSYALVATGYSAKYDPEDYRLAVPDRCDPGPEGYRYYVDALEDTHVVEVGNGYEINLFTSQVFGCAPHPVSSVPVQVEVDGTIIHLPKVKLFEEDSESVSCCVD